MIQELIHLARLVPLALFSHLSPHPIHFVRFRLNYPVIPLPRAMPAQDFSFHPHLPFIDDLLPAVRAFRPQARAAEQTFQRWLQYHHLESE